jgi:hypothetical protein
MGQPLEKIVATASPDEEEQTRNATPHESVQTSKKPRIWSTETAQHPTLMAIIHHTADRVPFFQHHAQVDSSQAFPTCGWKISPDFSDARKYTK